MNKGLLKTGIFPIRSISRLEHLLGTGREELRHIAEAVDSYYAPFDQIRTTSDGRRKTRRIDNPTGELKKIQAKINGLLSTSVFPTDMHGGIPGKSTKSNALPHLRQPLVAKIDLKNCFPNTSHRKVFKAFRETLECVNSVASILTRLTTWNGCLPQGASSSTLLCNLCLLPLRDDISRISEELALRQTIFVDDITISGIHTREAIEPIIKMILIHGYSVRNRKVQVMPASCRQETTGVGLNRKFSVRGNKYENIRLRILRYNPASKNSQKGLDSIMGFIAHATFINRSQGASLRRLLSRVVKKNVVA